MSDWEKANELMENLIRIYSPKLTQDEVHMLKSHMLSGTNIEMTLFNNCFIVTINREDDSRVSIEGARELKVPSWNCRQSTII